jgi:hypothetical protein
MTMQQRLARVAAWLCLGLTTAVMAADPPPAPMGWAADATGATAAAYCMAKHPYQVLTSQTVGRYTKDGYELVGSPGVVGTVRRNFVYDRSTDAADEGGVQTCAQACAQFGKPWGLVGKSLRQKVGDGNTLIASGLGDLGALVGYDQDHAMGGQSPGLIGSRANTWQQSDVAQADYCCCHAVSAAAQ